MKCRLDVSLILALLVLLGACGGGGTDDEKAKNEQTPTPPVGPQNGPNAPTAENSPAPPAGANGNNASALVDVTPKNNFMPDLEFNTYAGSDNQSDTTGTLPGAVLFAQSQIFPATVRMANDVQPYMTSLRDALVLFKPSTRVNLVAGKGIVLKAYKRDGSLLDTLMMEHPNDIPKTPRFLNNVDLASIQFDLNPKNPKVISSAADMNYLNDKNAAYLKSLLATNDSIQIKLANGYWTRDIYLPSGSDQGKRILITSAAGATSTVHYTDERGFEHTKDVTTNTNVAFNSISASRWVNQLDIDHSSYVYGKNFWTAKLPKEWIQPGLKLEFIQGDKKGSLNFAAQGLTGLKIGAPTELLINVIDLGMLTSPRDTFEFAKDDSSHAEYFQTIPASRFIVSRYESLKLDKVVMPNGNVYTANSPDPSVGGWQSGDMRGSIAKLLVSHGINNANYGISSSSSKDEGWNQNGHPYWAAQLTAHTSVGKYTNGTYVHGGSGGAGMVTLENTVGNEWSHEVGHNYGLDHGSGARGVQGAIHRPSTDVNSTWAWDSNRNVFIPNFVQKPTYQTGIPPQSYEKTCKYTYQIGELSNVPPSECVTPFEINRTTAFSFGRDAMSDGIPNGAPYWKQVNRFTIYSPDSASQIQNFLESKVVFDKTSSTGFRLWNPTTFTMEEKELRAPYYTSIDADVTSARIANTGAYAITGGYSAYLQSLYDSGVDIVSVKMSNGLWGSSATAPAAASNNGKWLTIAHGASMSTTWSINGQSISFATGQTNSYQSDGTRWVQVANAVDTTVARKPERFGVPVTTILGYYDPQRTIPSATEPAYMYPALHGAYGYVYPSDSNVRRTDGCWLEVSTTTPNSVRRYKLGSQRYSSGYMNKFQVNVPQSEGAQQAAVFCGGVKLSEKALTGPSNPASLTYTVQGMPLPNQ